MKKRQILSLMLSFIMIFSVFAGSTVTANALTEGNLSYEIEFPSYSVVITECSKSASGAVVIPDSINGYPVTKIADSAFNKCKMITSVKIPDGVTIIGENAFRDCTNLTEVTIPDSVQTIRFGAFFGCASLKNVLIPAGVTDIGNYAFGYYLDNDKEQILLYDDFVITTYTVTEGESYAQHNKIKFNYVSLSDKKTSVSVVSKASVIADGAKLKVKCKEKSENKVVYDVSVERNGEIVEPYTYVYVSIPVPKSFTEDNYSVILTDQNGRKVIISPKELHKKLYRSHGSTYENGFVTVRTGDFGTYEITKERILMGDVNGDGRITAADARLMLRFSARLEELDNYYCQLADVNADNFYNAADARIILRAAAHLDLSEDFRGLENVI